MTDRLELFGADGQVDAPADSSEAEVDQMVTSDDASDDPNDADASVNEGSPDAIEGSNPDTGEVGTDACSTDSDCEASDDP